MISVKIIVIFKNGMNAIRLLEGMLIMKAIIPGKNEINVSGVRALCASLNVFDFEAIAIQRPLIKNE